MQRTDAFSSITQINQLIKWLGWQMFGWDGMEGSMNTLFHRYTTMTTIVVSIGPLTAFYVVLVPMVHIPSKPPLCAFVIVSFCTCKKGPIFCFEILRRLGASANYVAIIRQLGPFIYRYLWFCKILKLKMEPFC